MIVLSEWLNNIFKKSDGALLVRKSLLQNWMKKTITVGSSISNSVTFFTGSTDTGQNLWRHCHILSTQYEEVAWFEIVDVIESEFLLRNSLFMRWD